MFRLFTTYFDSGHEGRQEELDFCLQVNESAFDFVYIYSEKVVKPDWCKCYWHTGKRKKFSDLLDAASRTSEEDDIVVVANSDIVFTKFALHLIDENLEENEVYCLSRWDFLEDKGCIIFDRFNSQDSWIFRGPPKEDIGGDFYFGQPGCDNRIMHELDEAGYKVSNPSRSIKTYHPHVCGLRPSNKQSLRVPLPYLHCRPTKLGEKPRYEVPDRLPRKEGSFQK
jgi:hypothetical protein